MLSHVKMARRSFIIKKMYDTEMYALVTVSKTQH